jgi:hypothetical protein
MEHSMKMLLAIALGTVLAAPAFAQAPNSRQTSRQESSRAPVYTPDYSVRQYGNRDTTVLGDQPWWRTQNWCVDARGTIFLCR